MMRTWPAPMGSLWLHGSSVGEVAATEALWRVLPGPRFITTDTATGLARARRFTPLSARLPHLPWAATALWAQARPRAVVFVEGTYWPGLARRAHEAGVPVLRVSCKAGPQTRRVPPELLRRLWRHTTAVAARDEHEAAFLSRCQPDVRILGDLKTSIRPPPSPLRWTRPFVVGASLRDGDTAALLAAVRVACPEHAVLLAPRHLERFDPEILRGLRWARRTALPDAVPPDIDIVWLDTLGELDACLQGASAAFIGGTFSEAIGGHSPREAQAWGVPVVAGPHRLHPQAFDGATTAASPALLAGALREALEAGGGDPAWHPVAEQTAAFVMEHVGPAAPEVCPRPWARPLQRPYAAGWHLKAALDRRRPVVSMPVPVISVGSANARSPGRSSTVAWLLKHLAQQGHVVGVAVRGYRRAVGGRGLHLSTTDARAAVLGDEGAMLAWLGAMVAAGPDRAAAARALVGAGCTVVVLDDGRQCRWLLRDIEIEVVDGRYPQARGLLPAGECREPRAGHSDVRLVHHGEAYEGGGIRVERRPGPWFRGGRPADPPAGPVAVCLGLGHPESFLEDLELPVARQRLLGDHRTATDLASWAAGLPLVCSTKDWARLPPALATAAWHRGVELDVPDTTWLEGVR